MIILHYHHGIDVIRRFLINGRVREREMAQMLRALVEAEIG